MPACPTRPPPPSSRWAVPSSRLAAPSATAGKTGPWASRTSLPHRPPLKFSPKATPPPSPATPGAPRIDRKRVGLGKRGGFGGGRIIKKKKQNVATGSLVYIGDSSFCYLLFLLLSSTGGLSRDCCKPIHALLVIRVGFQV